MLRPKVKDKSELNSRMNKVESVEMKRNDGSGGGSESKVNRGEGKREGERSMRKGN